MTDEYMSIRGLLGRGKADIHAMRQDIPVELVHFLFVSKILQLLFFPRHVSSRTPPCPYIHNISQHVTARSNSRSSLHADLPMYIPCAFQLSHPLGSVISIGFHFLLNRIVGILHIYIHIHTYIRASPHISTRRQGTHISLYL